MVDSTKGIGPVPGQTSSRTQPAANDKRTEEKKSEEIRDKVEISEKALSLAQAEQAANDAKASLQNNKDVTLGLNPAILDETV